MKQLKTPYQSLLPPLSRAEFDALKASIEAEGVRDAIIIDEDNNILDGYHRYSICKTAPIRVLSGLTESEKKAFVFQANVARRNLSPEQKREVRNAMKAIAEALRAEDPKKNTQARVAAKLGVDEGTIRYWLGTKGKKGTNRKIPNISLPDARVKVPPKERPKLAGRVNAGEKPEQVAADYGISIRHTRNIVKAEKQTAEKMALRKKIEAEGRKVKQSDKWHIYHADMQNWTALRQYDYIITDPPYGKDYLKLWNDLGRQAKLWLTDSGLLIAMSGQSYLDQIYQLLSQHLSYYWTACYLTPGQPTPLRQVNVNCCWKPILIYSKSKYEGKTFSDVFKSERPEKDLHKWSQSESGMVDIVSKICLPGQYILDPFCGSATTGIAAIRHGCFFDGLDNDQDSIAISKGRLSKFTKRLSI